ncbi:hypothetical protein B0H16DRAFT_46918 [Mycena metata]|uniref:Uncharacterized protein n=1 Tax=Mycena metata TaxID=1033252 RepID=A0AAD7NUI5_9AGAR|nr:hypothetical protein B0H16DRAFT_46918 [Mycena metata]
MGGSRSRIPPLPRSSMATPHLVLPRVAGNSSVGAGPAADPFAGAETQLVFAITSSVAFALIAWEYVAFLPHEIGLYRRPVWGTLPPYAFLGLRYGGILATFPLIFLSAVKINTCQAAASLSQAGIVVIITSSTIVFTFRTSSLWGDNRIIRWALGALSFVVLICWTALATQYRAVLGPDVPFGSNCRVLRTVPWLPVGNVSTTIFFVTALVLTLLKMQYYQPKDSEVTSRVYRDNVLYLIGTTGTAVTALIIKSLAPPSSALVLSTVSTATVLTTAFGTRAFRNLMLAAALEMDADRSLPYPSSSPIVSHDSEKRYAHSEHALSVRPAPSLMSRSVESLPHLRTAESNRPHTADSARPRTVAESRPSTADSRRPNTADSPHLNRSASNRSIRQPITARPYVASSTRPHTADSTRPHTGGSTRPPTGTSESGSTAPLIPNPYTTFPSPPNSYTNHSLMASSLPSNAPLSTSANSMTPLRRGDLRETRGYPRSEWSDS